MAGQERVLCPHCGAENPKSIIVTTCHACRGSLTAGPPAAPTTSAPKPAPVAAARPAPVAAPRPAPVAAPKPAPVPRREPPREPRQTPSAEPVREAPLPPPTANDVVREVRRVARGGLGVGLFIALLAGVFLGGIVSESTGRFSFAFCLPAIGLAVFVVVRAWITAGTYSVMAGPPPGPLAIGEAFSWGLRIHARRELTLATATVTLRCREHAIVRQGKSTAHYRRPIFEQHYRVAARRLQPGEAWEVRPEMAIPTNAIPSWDEHHRRIEWSLEVDVPTEGLCANVREEVPLRVMPKIVGAGHADDRHVPVQWLAAAPIVEGRVGRITPGGVEGSSGEKLKGISALGDGFVASLEVTDGVASDHGPVLAAGTTRELKLTVEAREPLQCRGLRVWIGCRLGAHGSTEKIELFHEESVWSGDLPAGQRVETPIRIVVPRDGPVTYIGEHVRFDWVVRLRVDVPLWRDRVADLPFVVTPQAVQA